MTQTFSDGIKNISGWEAQSQRKKWNFQRFRKTLTTKTQRHEVLVKRLGMRMVIGHWSLVIGHWALVIGHWSLVTGHWSLVISKEG